MRINPGILLVTIIFGLVSCQKEYSFESGGVPVVPANGKLINYLLKDDASTIESNFTYNNANKITARNLSAVAGPFNASIITKATYNSNNLLISAQMVFVSTLNPDGDTMNYSISRAPDGKVNYYLVKFTDFLDNGYDSIVCTYNAANKLILQINYFIEPITGLAEPFQRIELTYNRDNLVGAKDFELAGSLTSTTLTEESTFEFDDKPAALTLEVGEYLVGMGIDILGVNNVIKSTSTNYIDPSLNVITEYAFTYNGPNGKPSSAVVTTTRPGLPPGIGSATYVYQ